jgi:UDP-N-acetylmuramoylalanine--D-glutamate ligase
LTCTPVHVPERLVLVGFGAANRAVAAALVRRGHRVVATDDQPTPELDAVAAELGIELVAAPDVTRLGQLVRETGAVVASPGLPDRHPAFALAEDAGVPVLTELDLAGAWDSRPIAAITGTDGKTTVTTLVTAMLRASGIRCVDAGNNDLPLVRAIDDPDPEWFVVEASSFRLGRSHGWAPRVATWLNLAPDHLDVHATHEAYELAKARIWASQGPGDVAVGNLDDPVVAAHLAAAKGRRIGFSLVDPAADYRIADDHLVGPDGPIVGVSELPRRLPHDLANGLAAAATARAAGASPEAVAGELCRARPMPHRVEHVATVGGIEFYDDSKATVPHATLAAVRGFPSVVLIAGGRNKGLDLRVLAEAADHVRAVVAIGEAADEVVAAFDGIRPAEVAGSMADAVARARDLAEPGDVVLLSPACASFDWYSGYAARGEDFANRARALQEHA